MADRRPTRDDRAYYLISSKESRKLGRPSKKKKNENKKKQKRKGRGR
jgi:hypothetical protein